jgi:hypothetical protein
LWIGPKAEYLICVLGIRDWKSRFIQYCATGAQVILWSAPENNAKQSLPTAKLLLNGHHTRNPEWLVVFRHLNCGKSILMTVKTNLWVHYWHKDKSAKHMETQLTNVDYHGPCDFRYTLKAGEVYTHLGSSRRILSCL